MLADRDMTLPRSEEFFGYGSIEVTHEIECRAGEAVPLHIGFATASGNGFAAIRVGIRPPEPADLMDRAVAAAADADVAVVMVGTNDEWETEGHDRTTMDLPGRQDELVRRVVAANPNTAVIVNAGSPVTMDWADPDDPGSAPAILTSFFAGQEQAEALVDVLLGVADPGGRLPTTHSETTRRPSRRICITHPTTTAPGRAPSATARACSWATAATTPGAFAPRFPFGHGLSYGAAEWGAPTASATTISRCGDDGVSVSVPVTATGDRDATVVVQGYVAPGGAVGGSTAQGTQGLGQAGGPGRHHGPTRRSSSAPRRSTTGTPRPRAWMIEPGDYDLVIAASADDEHARIRDHRSPDRRPHR